MIAKAGLFVICLLSLVACQLDIETIETTPETIHPTLTKMVQAQETAVPPPPTPTTTTTPAPPTLEPTTTPLPTPSPTPEPMLPTASLLFVRDNNLQQWIPRTGEVKTLTENVPRYIVYSGAIAVFVREVIPEQEYALVVFHVPTQSEVQLFKSSSSLNAAPFDEAISISPNGRWLAYVTGESRNSATLTVHEMMIDNQQLAVSEPVLTVTPGQGWNWPYDQMMWATENELSWSDKSGIWVADLSSDPITPVVAIAPSTNTFPFYSLNPADSDKEPLTVFTTFIPYQWSPDGRYLLVVEYYDEYGEFRVIERVTNRLFIVPESGIGPVSDNAIWLDETTLLHYQAFGNLNIWQIDMENRIFIQKTITAEMMGYVVGLWSFGNHVRVTDYSSLFDLNLETGEVTELAQHIRWPLSWTPDGQNVLWNETKYIDDERLDYVFLDNLNGDVPIELDSVLGLHSCCWHWYEE
ncbi:MAG: PD40 domain-containing protein [Ardenticatenaceae bacterium]|nr:PD40 domain-containing protein [Ardenticatenaceae bacterium]